MGTGDGNGVGVISHDGPQDPTSGDDRSAGCSGGLQLGVGFRDGIGIDKEVLVLDVFGFLPKDDGNPLIL